METQKRNRLESHRSTSSTRHHHHHHLPQEIVEQIMIKLPTKSILRFKCVSKSWRSITSSDRFIKAHLEKSSSKHGSLERHHITFENYDTHPKKKRRCSLPSFLYGPAAQDDDTAVADFHYPTCAPEDSAAIVGSCNGLLCVLKNKIDFILWNPTTRKFRSLPPALDDAELNYLSSGGSRLFAEAYGFCFDESDDDYKVFGMWRRSPPLPPDDERKLLVKMYSSKMDSWRRVDDPVLDSVCEFAAAAGRFACGNLYWEGYRTGDDEGWRIISFDLENEAFGAVEWPGGLGEQEWRLARAIDGLLCCFNPDSCTQPDHIDYWVLEDGPWCWCRFATLGCPRLVEDEIEIDGDDDWFYPLFVGPGGGDILAEHNGSVVVFAKEEGGAYSGPKVLGSGGYWHTSIYVESLVEP